MPDGQVLEFSGVTKRFGAVTAVSGLSARIEPGQVTGFLGPNGAGKTTTLRILLGLVRATDGSATIGGVPYTALRDPLRSVGAVLEASSFHPGRSAANHLTVYAQAAGLRRARVDEVLDTVGLADVAGRKVGGFSLGMRQRLGLATALLGDPGVLVLDEPSNGLDPEGIRWMRSLLRRLAEEGRTVLISSHLLAEVQQTVDTLLIIAGGKLVFQGDFEDLAAPDDIATIVDAPDRAALQAAIAAEGFVFDILRTGLTVRGAEPVQVGAIAAAAGVSLSTLQRKGAGLEDVFLDLVNGVRVHPSAGNGPAEPVPGTAAPAATPAAVAASTTPERGDDSEGSDDAETSTTRIEPSTSTDLVPVVRAARAERSNESDAGAPASAKTFTVATTGVIDVITLDDAPTAVGVPAARAGTPPETGAPQTGDRETGDPETGDPETGDTGDPGDEEWLDEVRSTEPVFEGEISAPDDDGGERTDTAPQEQPAQPGSLEWAPGALTSTEDPPSAEDPPPTEQEGDRR